MVRGVTRWKNLKKEKVGKKEKSQNQNLNQYIVTIQNHLSLQ